MALKFTRDMGMPQPYGGCEYLRMNVSDLPDGNEETYNPIQAVMDIYTGFRTHHRCWQYLQKDTNQFSDFLKVASITPMDVIVTVLFTIAWILARVAFVERVFKVISFDISNPCFHFYPRFFSLKILLLLFSLLPTVGE